MTWSGVLIVAVVAFATLLNLEGSAERRGDDDRAATMRLAAAAVVAVVLAMLIVYIGRTYGSDAGWSAIGVAALGAGVRQMLLRPSQR